ncbi:hypothetical protein FB561_2483 [Kribbella amoyensis]|uniref:Uncharacterized protein n=1 Tax=Kribbella amoyensis TaxID=996641 RepID=A0A561BR59_9ACTN|nr:hypothetical protein [Kribbella amoyensis]TWD81370.1 hypothetical protein FB561_2483 [Kribbella amoyensis]
MTDHGRSLRTVLTSVGLVGLVTLGPTSCGNGSASACEKALTTAATSVNGVVRAEFTCKRSFGNPSQKGSVTTSGTTQQAVTAVMEDVLRAFARSAELDDASVVYVDFANEPGTISVVEASVGFNGTPSIGDLRDHYDIRPN